MIHLSSLNFVLANKMCSCFFVPSELRRWGSSQRALGREDQCSHFQFKLQKKVKGVFITHWCSEVDKASGMHDSVCFSTSLHCFLSFKFSSTSRRTSFSRFSTYACTRTTNHMIDIQLISLWNQNVQGFHFSGLIVRCVSSESVIFQLKGCTLVISNDIGGLRCCFSLTSVLTKLYAFLITILFRRHKHYHERLDSIYKVLYISWSLRGTNKLFCEWLFFLKQIVVVVSLM